MDLSDRLDEDIARVRAEIQSLTKRKKLFTASLLSSSKVQSQLGLSGPLSNRDTNPLILSQVHHNESNVYRLAYGVTAFPFYDPNPEVTHNPLLGIRIDVPSLNGKFERAPYYMFCKRVTPQSTHGQHPTHNVTRSDATALAIHHHTIPALVPVDDYSARYLPPPPLSVFNGSADTAENHRDEGYHGSGQSSSPSPSSPQTSTVPRKTNGDDNNNHHPQQDLHGLVAAVRNDLVSWVLRQDSLTHVCSALDLPNPISGAETSDDGNNVHDRREVDRSTSPHTSLPQEQVHAHLNGKFSVRSVVPLGVDARLARVQWTDGRVARVKILDDGSIKRVIVFGEDGRLRPVERILSTDVNGRRLMVVDLANRLREVEHMTRSPDGSQSG